MNAFKKGLQVPVALLENKTLENEAIKKHGNEQLAKYMQIHDNSQMHNYFHHLVAAIMISQYEMYEFSGINIPYRLKAPNSIENKLKSRLKTAKVTYDINQKMHVNNVKPIFDIFAMKIIARRRPPNFYSTDPEINKLIGERKANQVFLEEMQEFRGRLIENEYTKKGNYTFKCDCTKSEYYLKCRELISRLKKLVDPQSTNVIEKYNQQLMDIDTRLELIEASKVPGEPDEMVTQEDLSDPNINFFTALTSYETRFYDKSDLAILTKQFISLFEDNKMFDKLGISLYDPKNPVEKKRTPNGYESNFIILNTLLGPIECQIQTENQYRFGNYGFAAHTKFKSVKPLQIPDIKDKYQILNFVQQINKLVPKGYLARMDDNEPGRAMIQKFNDYQNYKGLITQVAKGDPAEKLLRNYFSKLYALRKQIFKTQEKSMGYIDFDIEDYVQSDEFKQLKQKSSNLSHEQDDDIELD